MRASWPNPPLVPALVRPLGFGAAALALALALASPPAGAASAAPPCQPASLDSSAALAGGAVTVSPTPGSLDASHLTQISFLGAPAEEIEVVAVTGSRSGAHPGQLLAYSQGDGASFVPATPFIPGELVTVEAVLDRHETTTPFSWQFTVAEPDTVSRSLETPPGPAPTPRPGEVRHFVSNPALQPPTVTTDTDAPDRTHGDLFLAPYAGPGQAGPMILDANGALIWFKPLPAGARAADLRVQQYEGRPVLTWWQDPLVAGGRSDAGVVIANSSYREIATVRAGNGYQADLHAFQITSRDSALLTVYDAIRCNLSAYGGPANGAVADTLLQEIDLRTGLVRFEWHSLDHVALSDSYQPVRPGTPASPWDFFHINAVEAEPDGELLVDSRNTWAAYDLDAGTGQIVWRIGGKESSFAIAPGASPAWQHDARVGPDGSISFFDNGATPKVHAQSRGLVLALDAQTMSASLITSFVHPTPLISPSQGDLQPLAGGGWFVGWGQEPYLSEFAADGKLLFDAHLPPAYQSYTVRKYAWSGDPLQPPRIAVRSGAHRATVVYASWNGATAVARWRLLAGTSPRALRPVALAARSRFETAIALPAPRRYLAVQALGKYGRVLGTSAVVGP